MDLLNSAVYTQSPDLEQYLRPMDVLFNTLSEPSDIIRHLRCKYNKTANRDPPCAHTHHGHSSSSSGGGGPNGSNSCASTHLPTSATSPCTAQAHGMTTPAGGTSDQCRCCAHTTCPDKCSFESSYLVRCESPSSEHIPRGTCQRTTGCHTGQGVHPLSPDSMPPTSIDTKSTRSGIGSRSLQCTNSTGRGVKRTVNVMGYDGSCLPILAGEAFECMQVFSHTIPDCDATTFDEDAFAMSKTSKKIRTRMTKVNGQDDSAITHIEGIVTTTPETADTDAVTNASSYSTRCGENAPEVVTGDGAGPERCIADLDAATLVLSLKGLPLALSGPIQTCNSSR